MPKTKHLVCSECPTSLKGKQAGAITCSRKCRDTRRVRQARENREKRPAHRPTDPPEVQGMSLGARGRGEMKHATHEVLKEELRPLVREAITADVLEAIGQLVGLTPLAVRLLEADLASPIDEVRSKAYALILRYSMGNSSVAPAPADVQPAPITVQFMLPRPDDPAPAVDPVARQALLGVTETDGVAVEIRDCVECKQPRNADEFVEDSDRCRVCDAALKAEVAVRFG